MKVERQVTGEWLKSGSKFGDRSAKGAKVPQWLSCDINFATDIARSTCGELEMMAHAKKSENISAAGGSISSHF
jgi:hypothetical protein